MGQEVNIDMSIGNLLEKLEFVTDLWYIQQQYQVELQICGEWVDMEANLAVCKHL